MSCPYFIPREPVHDGAGIGRPNPPLGEFYAGSCAADESGGCEAAPLESCNFGYARGLPCFPSDSPADAVRFSVEEGGDRLVRIRWCEELDHLPVRDGIAEQEMAPAGGSTTESKDAFEAQLRAYAASYRRARNGARRS